MAKPDLDDGWLKIAHELLAAIFAADFSKRALIVLREVFEQSFALGRPEVWLDPMDISNRSSLSRSHAWDGVKELVDDRVLAPNPNGSYRLLKDYEGWLRNGGSKARTASPRLSQKDVLYAQAAPSRVASLRPYRGTPSVPIQGRKAPSARPYPGTQVGPGASLARDAATPPSVPIQGRAPIEEAPARRKEGRSEKEEASATAAAADGGRAAAVGLARELFGDEAAEAIEAEAGKIDRAVDGRWDRVGAALRQAAAKPGGVFSLVGFVLAVAPGASPAAAVSAVARAAPEESPARRRQRELIEGFARRAARNKETSTHDGQ